MEYIRTTSTGSILPNAGSILNGSISGTIPPGAGTTLRTTRLSEGSRPTGTSLSITLGLCTQS